jgi:hypothetical protein
MKKDTYHLQIVSFNVPYPPDYGGVIDVFYRIKALHQLGVKIYLHCFEYNRPRANELEHFCEKVFYYKRRDSLLHLFSRQPYIVSSRKTPKLLRSLSSIKAPILFEGEHTTSYIDHKKLQNHHRWVRLHNIEHRYYRELAKQAKNYFKRLYFQLESRKLSHYEKRLQSATGLLSISKTETEYFQQLNPNTHWLPAFHAEWEKQSLKQEEDSFLYHGDLSIQLNLSLAERLADLFRDKAFSLCIAGKMESSTHARLQRHYPWVNWQANPSETEMENILKKHRIHLIFSHHREGVKLKLVHSLLSGANVLANKNAVHGSGLEEHIQICNINELKSILKKSKNPAKRHDESLNNALASIYKNEKNALKLLQLIFKN